MWKPSQTGPVQLQLPRRNHPAHATPAPVFETGQPSRRPLAPGDQATIGKGLFIKGEITGSESLFIDGKVEGSINLPGNRVTVGRNGQVAASITAREIVVLGKVRGNVTATDRVDIRAEGSLSGDVAAARISIEDGAFFKGGIDIRKPEGKPGACFPAHSAICGSGQAGSVIAVDSEIRLDRKRLCFGRGACVFAAVECRDGAGIIAERFSMPARAASWRPGAGPSRIFPGRLW